MCSIYLCRCEPVVVLGGGGKGVREWMNGQNENIHLLSTQNWNYINEKHVPLIGIYSTFVMYIPLEISVWIKWNNMFHLLLVLLFIRCQVCSLHDLSDLEVILNQGLPQNINWEA